MLQAKQKILVKPNSIGGVKVLLWLENQNITVRKLWTKGIRF